LQKSRHNHRDLDMDACDWRFPVMNAVRLSFREKWTIEQTRERVNEILKEYEEKCPGKGEKCSEKS
jgi:hypothetical protein